MAPRRAGFPNRVRTRRNTDWSFGPDILVQTVSTSTKLLGTTSLTVTEQQTIVRIRGLFHVTLTAAAAADNGFAGAVGIALVNSDAFAQGINSIPGPVTDAHWDAWMFHSFFDVRSITATIADGVNAVAVEQRVPIDSKAMRKWDPAETLIIMAEFVETGTATARVNADMRMLLKAA